MKIICCYIPQSEGTATVNGFDTVEQSMDVRRQVGYLPEHNPLYLDMYVKEYLAFIAGLHMKGPQITKRVAEMVEMTGLQIEQKKKIGALSKGYRQRVGLAQAMIHNPSVLILDEPTSGLDPNQLVDIRSLIKNIGKEKTVILSTHIMQEVEAICDRVIIINRGKIVADDKTSVIQQKTRPDNVLEVEFDTSVDLTLLKTVKGISKAESLGANKYRIYAPTGADPRGDLFEFAVRNKIKVLELQKSESSLEEVFQSLTGGKK
jgi:ABC-2 type transport system ATP-binding protein